MQYFSNFILLVFLCLRIPALAQDSLLAYNREEVVVTATRMPLKISNIAVPVSILNKKQILQTGAVKLNELLQEQTGMFISNGSGSRAVGGGVFGNGLQMQGMSPDHTLILIDGEPVNGRQGGVLDLSRIATGNIKKLEIIKGPYSSMYGSEAMGGVVNIITENNASNAVEAIVRYGSFQTLDAQIKKFLSKGKWQGYLFTNGFTSKGFDLNTTDIEKTLEPYRNISTQGKLTYATDPFTKFNLSVRYFSGVQESRYAINSGKINVSGAADTKDLAANFKLDFRIFKKYTSVFSVLVNQYQYNQLLDSIATNTAYYKDQFAQNMFRAEQQTNISVSKNLLSILGYGYTLQNVNTERYTAKKQQNAFHFYNQNEIKSIPNLNLSVGTRFDYNTAYRFSINPKIAGVYKINNKLRIHANAGSGFKAPDFRQLYLDFINNAADSYIIYGAESFSYTKLQEQLAGGYLAVILPAAQSITTLKPEQSTGMNSGLQYKPNHKYSFDLHLFRNDVKNLIQYVEVAKRPNGASVFSYWNINNSFTQGVETNMQFNNHKNFDLSCGYQYLETADKEILENIKLGKVYGRNGIAAPARIMLKKDYNGLQNRSKHTAILKINYSYKFLGLHTRFIARSKWGVVDYDGNGFANMPEEFAKGFLQINCSISLATKKHWNFLLGLNNITNYTDAQYLTNVPGINFNTTITYKL